MELSTLTQASNSAVRTAATGPSNNKAAGVLSSDFETFLKMLTAQMKNQDPLNPVESSEFAVQLATFSSVEQQVLTNNLLTELGARLDTLGMGQLAGWIGMEARVVAPVNYRGDAIPVTATVDPLADAAELVVTDAQGFVVQKQPILPQSGRLVWTGLDSAGIPLPEGSYSLSVRSLNAGEVIATREAEIHSLITEARLNGGEVELVLAGGQTVRAIDVLGIRPIDG